MFGLSINPLDSLTRSLREPTKRTELPPVIPVISSTQSDTKPVQNMFNPDVWTLAKFAAPGLVDQTVTKSTYNKL